MRVRLANRADAVNYSPGAFSPLGHMAPHIRISPFNPVIMEALLKKETKGDPGVLDPGFWLDGGRAMVLTGSGRQALKLALKRTGLDSGRSVLIVTTTGGPYISSCVTSAIEEICGWSRTPEKNTGAILLIHEFGFPCPLPQPLRDLGLPVIEDCAYGTGSRTSGGAVGAVGDYAIYSLTKYYPLPFGGLLASRDDLAGIPGGHIIPDEDRRLLEGFLIRSGGLHEQWNETRMANWRFFEERLGRFAAPYFHPDGGIVPGVFAAKLPPAVNGARIKQSCVSAGIESTEYYGNGGFYFPVHQFLTDYEKSYILHHFLQGVS
ncbi:MAG: DegT/DnrJ/EryC1/StrS family aminotransferase [Nitrospiraceae bacterium]|nr:DegT/DnrJ/EryC1/StrS family aminotransferase [Nitrospiraceae bacterium]